MDAVGATCRGAEGAARLEGEGGEEEDEAGAGCHHRAAAQDGGTCMGRRSRSMQRGRTGGGSGSTTDPLLQLNRLQ